MEAEKFYRICWRDKLSGGSHQFGGLFSEADKELWLRHLDREDGPAGYEYWAEEVKAETESIDIETKQVYNGS